MAFRKIYDGLRIIAKALGTSSKLGDIESLELDPGEGYMTLHNGVSASEILTADHDATVTNKTISGSSNTLTDINGDSLVDNSVDLVKLSKVGNNRILYSSLNGDIGTLDQLTSQKVVITDSNGIPTTATASTAEVDYLVGVTSGIQDQLDDKLDLAGGTMEGSLDMDDNSITNIPDPVSNKDAVNKQYVDAIAQGLDLKSSVRVATTTSGTLSSSFENGDTVDGVVLATNDRILIKNQVSEVENGIYIVQASGSPLRSSDADTWDKLVGSFCFVEEGTTNADTGWACNIDSSGTINVNDVTFIQFSSAGVIQAGEALTKTGTTLDVNYDDSTIGLTGNKLVVKAGGITDTEINASAAMARSKLASGTASHVVINDGSGVLSSEATLAKSRGGSGQDNSSLTFPASGTLATLAGTEVLTNKDFDGGTASNSSRLTLPKDTKANLDSLNRKEGTVVYATDQARAFIDNGTSLVQIGSGSGGGINYIENPDAEVNTDGWELYSDRLSMSNVDVVGDAMDFVLNGATQGSTPAVGTRIRYMGTVANGNMSLNTDYYVSTAPLGQGTTSNPWTFGVSATQGGSTVNITSTAGLNNSDFYPYAPLMGYGNLAYPDITWTRVTSSPMSGDAMFRLSKPASNCLGQGVAYDFTIDKADQGSVLTIGAKYNISSGTFTTGDLTVYIYDVTNKTIVQPSGFQVEAVGSNIYASINATFQSASNSTSYRLIFHVSSTSASAYTVDFDRISVSPQVVPMGAPVTDWVSYTPTLGTSGGGSITLNATSQVAPNGRWRRVGDSMQVQVSFRNGTGGAASGAAGSVLIPLPSGYSPDTSKITTGVSGVQAFGTTLTGTTGAGTVGVLILASGSNFLILPSGGATVAVSDLAASYFAEIDFMVPIVGWSSSTVVSSSANTRVVAFQGTNNPNSAIGGTFADMTWSAISVVTNKGGGSFNNATGSYTCPVPGTYRVGASIEASRTSGAATQYLLLRAYNATASRYVSLGRSTWISAGNEGNGVSGTGIIEANAGDEIRFQVASQGTGTAWSAATVGTQINIELINGPSQIAMSEVISMVARNSGAQAIAATTTPINYSTVIKDSHGGWNGSTYTCPAPGDYFVSAVVNYDTAVTPNIVVDGSAYCRLATGTAAGVAMSGSCLVANCVAGTTIQIRANATGNVNSDSNAKISIHRLGGM